MVCEHSNIFISAGFQLHRHLLKSLGHPTINKHSPEFLNLQSSDPRKHSGTLSSPASLEICVALRHHLTMSNVSVLVPFANASTTLDQFYCQNTRDDRLSCLSLPQFATSNFDQLCPSGNCLEACGHLERLYGVIPLGIQVQADNFGLPTRIPDMITLYGICLGYANISRALDSGIVPQKEAGTLRPLFPSNAEGDLQRVSDGASRCLSETCERAANRSECAWECSPAQLLLNSTTPRLSGPYQCLKTICKGSTGLPFANQDVVGVGVWCLLASPAVAGEVELCPQDS